MERMMPGRFVNGRIAFLKAELKITPAQDCVHIVPVLPGVGNDLVELLGVLAHGRLDMLPLSLPGS